MEIERKWMVEGWPEDLPVLVEQQMRQGYVSVRPTVRIREELLLAAADNGMKDDPAAAEVYMLCFKSAGGLAREEIEFPIEKKYFQQLEKLIGYPLIPKLRRTYLIPDGRRLEVSHVDEGQPTEFWYAEVEFDSVAEAEKWDPARNGLEKYLWNEVTGQPGQSMGAFWEQTRLKTVR